MACVTMLLRSRFPWKYCKHTKAFSVLSLKPCILKVWAFIQENKQNPNLWGDKQGYKETIKGIKIQKNSNGLPWWSAEEKRLNDSKVWIVLTTYYNRKSAFVLCKSVNYLPFSIFKLEADIHDFKLSAHPDKSQIIITNLMAIDRVLGVETHERHNIRFPLPRMTHRLIFAFSLIAYP